MSKGPAVLLLNICFALSLGVWLNQRGFIDKRELHGVWALRKFNIAIGSFGYYTATRNTSHIVLGVLL